MIGTTSVQLNYLLYARGEAARYSRFTIKKRRGGDRAIMAPRPDLKSVQRKLADRLVEMYHPREVVYGFVAGRGIADNADRHLRCRHVLNVDLRDFFPSINFGRVRGLFIALGAQPAAATVLAQICCHENALPQGAPSSPIVSNMICMRMDRQLLALAKRHHCRYSRYADDLTFSRKSGAFPPEICHLDEVDGRAILGEELRRIIEANGFTPHTEKTWLFSRLHRQSVTGLVVNSKRNVPRQFVRRLRAMIHAWKAHGLERAEKEHREKYNRTSKRAGEPAPFNLIIRGKLEFLRMTKGVEDPVYRRLQQRLVEVDPAYFSVMQKENELMKRRDVFISHASEDKEALARPLAEGLLAEGVSVWYDEYCIRLGDDILLKIDEGLVNSQFGVIIFSPHFFEAKKTWTFREYTGLVAGEDVDKGKRILPIWHNITKDELYKKSPTIVNKLALVTSDASIADMVRRIVERVKDGRPTVK